MLEIVPHSVRCRSPSPGVPVSGPMSKWQSDTRIPMVLYSTILPTSGSSPRSLWAFCQNVLCWLALRSHGRARAYASYTRLERSPFVVQLPFRVFDPNATGESLLHVVVPPDVCLAGWPFQFLLLLLASVGGLFACQKCIMSSNLFRTTT